ncbi:MAG: helix-turn-helix domain-containing protein [Fimbriimonadaceae bacterium]|jgi:predicted transcriptional regulator|nr:helix-turn-helix domain-containing protein [Fimbriimonadaceae bacterium]QYK58032.1 MAG: helix-turn-helix domain-containing protein [Fimbriimonadaceae bacterium]
MAKAGRPAFGPEEARRLRELAQTGLAKSKLAALMDVSVPTVYKYLRMAEALGEPRGHGQDGGDDGRV